MDLRITWVKQIIGKEKSKMKSTGKIFHLDKFVMKNKNI